MVQNVSVWDWQPRLITHLSLEMSFSHSSLQREKALIVSVRSCNWSQARILFLTITCYHSSSEWLFQNDKVLSHLWPWTTKPVIRVIIQIYTLSESWINTLSIDVWFIRIGQYLAKIWPRWMLHIGGGWGDSPLLCKALWVSRKSAI